MKALAIGVPYDVFWHLTPRKLEYFFQSYQLKRRVQDERDYIMGIYVREALLSSVCNAFLWKQKGAEFNQYPSKPFMQLMSNKCELTETEKQQAVDLFFAQEKARRTNWQRTHKKDGTV